MHSNENEEEGEYNNDRKTTTEQPKISFWDGIVQGTYLFKLELKKTNIPKNSPLLCHCDNEKFRITS